jgi:histidinol-phosphatase (PHP family)
MKPDYHLHTKRCKHAEGEMRDYVEKAIDLQISEIAFTDHIPLPYNFDISHRMAYNELDDYLYEIKKLKLQYPELKIFSGIEADFYDGFEEYLYQTFQRFDFEIIIMSVHFIKNWPKNNWVFSYYFPDRPINEIYSDYLQAVKRGINTGLFDIIGHLDLIKSEDFPILDTNKSEVLDILKCAKNQSMIVEINTSGLRKDINEPYPSLDILPYLEKYKIPITFGSDAHKPEQVGLKFKEIESVVANYPDIKFATIKDGNIS